MAAQSRNPWVLLFPALCCLGILALLTAAAKNAAQGPAQASDQRADSAGARTVRLTIDYGDGVEKHFTRLRWTPEMTALDAMNQAAEHSRGIRFKAAGSGETAFLTQIDGLKNQGGGADSKNWQFRVNGKAGTKAFALYNLSPGDTLLWKFATYRPNKK